MGDIVRMVRKGKFIGWYVRYRDADGRRKQRASHQPSKEQARRYLLEIEGRVARGIVGIPEPATAGPTVSELCERFLAEYRQPRIKDLAKYRTFAACALRRALPTVGSLRADAVQPADLNRLRDALERRCAAGSVGLTLTFLKTAFAWAVRQGLVAKNPLGQLALPRPKDTVEYLSLEEARGLLSAADRQAPAGLTERLLRACVHLALRTGLRKGELFGLRWRDLDLSTGRLTVARSFATTPKSGRARQLRIPAAVAPILAEWAKECPHTSEGLVFPRYQDGSWGMLSSTSAMLGLPALLSAAGCRPLHRAWHALRHSFASHYIMQGGNILALQQILGHSDIKMTMMYAHLAPDFLGAEMDRLKI